MFSQPLSRLRKNRLGLRPSRQTSLSACLWAAIRRPQRLGSALRADVFPASEQAEKKSTRAAPEQSDQPVSMPLSRHPAAAEAGIGAAGSALGSPGRSEALPRGRRRGRVRRRTGRRCLGERKENGKRAERAAREVPGRGAATCWQRPQGRPAAAEGTHPPGRRRPIRVRGGPAKAVRRPERLRAGRCSDCSSRGGPPRPRIRGTRFRGTWRAPHPG
jgi:hypothetical protein